MAQQEHQVGQVLAAGLQGGREVDQQWGWGRHAADEQQRCDCSRPPLPSQPSSPLLTFLSYCEVYSIRVMSQLEAGRPEAVRDTPPARRPSCGCGSSTPSSRPLLPCFAACRSSRWRCSSRQGGFFFLSTRQVAQCPHRLGGGMAPWWRRRQLRRPVALRRARDRQQSIGNVLAPPRRQSIRFWQSRTANSSWREAGWALVRLASLFVLRMCLGAACAPAAYSMHCSTLPPLFRPKWRACPRQAACSLM